MANRLTKILPLLLVLPIVISPLYVFRFHLFIFPTTVLEVVTIAVITLYLCYKIITKEKPVRYIFYSAFGIALLALGFSLSLVTAHHAWEALGIYRAYFLEPLLYGLACLDYLAVHRKISVLNHEITNAHWFEYTLYLAAFWLSVVGILQGLFGILIVTAHQLDRAHGVFNNGNALALFIGPILLLLLQRLVSKHTTHKLLHLGVACVMFLAFILTKSTGGLLALGTTTVLYLAYNRLRWRRIYIFAALSALLIFSVVLLNINSLAPKVDNPWIRPGGTTQVRLCVWQGTWNLLQDHLFLGASLRGFQDLYSTAYVTCDAEPLVYPHNIFLNFWVETGIIGLVGVLLIFVIASSLFFWGTDIVLGISGLWDKVLPGSGTVIAPSTSPSDSYLLPPRLEALPTYTNQEKITVSGWSQPGSEVVIYINDTELSLILTDNSGWFEYLDLELSEGKNTVYAVTKKDEETSAPSDSQDVVLDTIKPSLTVSISDPDESGKVTVSGQSEVNSNIYVNGFRMILLSDGSFRDQVQLTDGENKIEIKSEDRAGNTETTTKTVTYTKPEDGSQNTPDE